MPAGGSTDREFDLVVYGASGFTGQYVVRDLLKQKRKCSWAVAGRSQAKITKCLRDLEEEMGEDLSAVVVMVADSGDYDSLLSMCQRAKVILNCVGPYRFYGEPVVRACVEKSTHHVDISGEPEFLEKMECLYDTQAKDAGCYIVGSCGFDSVPNDLGLMYCKQQFPGTLTGVESLLSINTHQEGRNGLNTGTWNTLVHSIGNWGELSQIRKKMNRPKLPKPLYNVPSRSTFWRPTVTGNESYYAPFMGADRSVVRRTQHLIHAADSSSHTLSSSFFIKVGGLLSVVKLIMFGLMFYLMSLTAFGRSLLIKYPHLFSGGFVYEGGPSKEIIDNQYFEILFRCYGYSQTELQADGSRKQPDKQVLYKVRGPDPGYVATASLLVESAYTFIHELETLPEGGGVITPGFAFKDSTLVERLKKCEVVFGKCD